MDLPAADRGVEVVRDMVAVYPGRVDRCTIDSAAMRPQAVATYGGGITDRVTGSLEGASRHGRLVADRTSQRR